MLPRERVLAAIAHREADRVPLYLWVFKQPGVIDDIRSKYGSMEAFCDALQLDMTQSFPAKGLIRDRAAGRAPDRDRERDPTFGEVLSLEESLEVELNDPDDAEIYVPIREEIAHHKGRRGRAVFVQTPGVFEAANGFLGLQQHLMELALQPEKVRSLYERIARWAARYAVNCLELGADVIHVSDDWGMNQALLFRPEAWWSLIYPTEQITCSAVKARGGLLSLHSDGYITPVLDGVLELGFDVFHPCQLSAGMDPVDIKARYGNRLALYGGLDVRTALGRNQPEVVAAEVRSLMRRLKPGGGYIFCTSHMVQPGTPIEEVEMAYRVALEESGYGG
jgi:uroporphyrinogen decarboxylase